MGKNTDVQLAAIMGAIVVPLLFVFSIVATVWHGYVFATLWQWFVMPRWSTQPISTVEASALFLMIGLVRPARSSKDAEWTAFLTAFLAPLSTLLFGWLLLNWQ